MGEAASAGSGAGGSTISCPIRGANGGVGAIARVAHARSRLLALSREVG